jgi:hypothetical protein
MAVASVFLTGAGPAVQGLANDLGRYCGIVVEPKEVLGAVALHEGLPSLQEPPCRNFSFTALAGLALAADDLELDLIPDTIKSKKAIIAKASKMTAFSVLLCVALASVALWAVTTYFMARARLRGLQDEVRRTEPKVRLIERQKKALGLVAERNDAKLKVVELLAAIHELTAGLYLDAVEYDAERRQIAVEGTAKSMRDISGLVQKMEQSPLFINVREGKSTQVDPKGSFRFQVVCRLEAGT